MITLKRAVQALIFVVIHAALAVLIMSQIAPSWIVGCGILAAAFATLLLFLFAGDEQAAKLFFFENWNELEEQGSPNLGFIFAVSDPPLKKVGLIRAHADQPKPCARLRY